MNREEEATDSLEAISAIEASKEIETTTLDIAVKVVACPTYLCAYTRHISMHGCSQKVLP